MADILDQKQEVIKVELTKHGKKLLGQGLFYPKYFSFFDDSVVYDTNYGNVEEETNSIEDRILNKSLTFSNLNNLDDIFLNRLGTSNTLNDYAPAWSIKVLNGIMNYDSESSSYHKKVFDLNEITYNVSLEKNTGEPVIDGDYFLLDLSELNLTDDIENFEIELFTRDSFSGLDKKLNFQNKNSNIIDDILYEESELPFKFFESKLTEDDAFYYFDVLVDDEIDTEYIVSAEKTLDERVKSTYSSNYTGPVDIKC